MNNPLLCGFVARLAGVETTESVVQVKARRAAAEATPEDEPAEP